LKNIRTIISTVAATAMVSSILVACAPNAKQLKEAIEKDPSIVFAAIQKDPEGFIEVVNKAARDAQSKGAEKAQQEENQKRDEEFKNPLKPEVQEGRAILGPQNAPITIVEYSDFECPYCSRGYQTMKEVKKAYPDQVRIVFKHLPLDFHPKAMPAAKYFEAIARQSAEMAYKWHDLIFENQNDLRSKGEAFMKDSAKKVGADLKKLEKDLNDPKLMERINADIEEAKKFGISGTPGFIINGVSLKGAYPFSEFKTIIDRHLAGSGK
jgi:protein-disulfide isomerase